jgi:hypothetical protein
MKTIMVNTKILFDMMREGFEQTGEPMVECDGELYEMMTPPNDND